MKEGKSKWTASRGLVSTELLKGKTLRDQVFFEWLKANLNGQPQEAKYQLNHWRESLKRPSVNWITEGQFKWIAPRGQVSTESLKGYP